MVLRDAFAKPLTGKEEPLQLAARNHLFIFPSFALWGDQCVLS